MFEQGISAVKEIQTSATFREFLVAGVQMLKDANVVHSQQSQKPTRRFSLIPDWMQKPFTSEQQQPLVRREEEEREGRWEEGRKEGREGGREEGRE